MVNAARIAAPRQEGSKPRVSKVYEAGVMVTGIVFLDCGARIAGDYKVRSFSGFTVYNSEARAPARMRRAASKVSPNPTAA